MFATSRCSRTRRAFSPSIDTLPLRLAPTVFPPLPPMEPTPIIPPCSADMDLPGWFTPGPVTNPIIRTPDPDYPPFPTDPDTVADSQPDVIVAIA
jgi:hypothetical protein